MEQDAGPDSDSSDIDRPKSPRTWAFRQKNKLDCVASQP